MRRAQKDERKQDDFWSAIAVADVLLVKQLFEGDLPDHIDSLIKRYTRAWKRFGSARELRSATEQVDFLADVLGDQPPNDTSADVKPAHALRQLSQALQELAQG
jgi:hypothetical protein